MSISSPRAFYGLSAAANPSKTLVSGAFELGRRQSQIELASTVAYSVRAVLADSAATLTVVLSTGVASGTTFAAGAPQVETATAAGTITVSGNATVTVTSAGMTGSPLAISVPVLEGDTASVWAAKIRTALSENQAVSGRFDVSGTGTSIILTRKTNTVGGVVLYQAGNDETLNIALANGTSTGITTAAASANTTTGVNSSGVKIFDGDGKDFEGNTIPAFTVIDAILLESSLSADVAVSSIGISGLILETGIIFLSTGDLSAGSAGSLTVTSGHSEIVLTVFGS
jgi:hypothetical protein